MKFIKKYSLAIIIVLFLLLCFKTCSSNSTKRSLEYNIERLNDSCRSLNDNIEQLNDSCRSLNDKIKSDSIKFTNIINEKDGTIIIQRQQIDSSQREKDNLYFILKENQKNNNKEK